MSTTFANHLLEGDHSSLPAAGDVPQGTLYACSDHSLIYQSDGSSSWATWYTGSAATLAAHLSDTADAHDASAISVLDTAGNFTATDVEAALAELQDNIDAVSGIGAVYASASTNTAQSFTTGAGVAIVDFEDVELDPGSDITTGASWKYTAPATGIYRVSAHVLFASSNAWNTINERALMQLFKNGSVYRTLARGDGYVSSGPAVQMRLAGASLISLNVTDTIDIRVAQNSGSNIALDGSAANNYIDIFRVA